MKNLTPIRSLHTLGPSGTNCEAAAHRWLARNDIDGEVVLHDTLEEGVATMRDSGAADQALLGCIVYPELHTLVFSNLKWLKLVDCFIMPTHSMVLARKLGNGNELSRVATHPAPQGLVPEGCARILVTSNSVAAACCASGGVDGCVTTLVAARNHGLEIVRDYGPVPMGFSIHVKF
jgi:hypothetical protein